MHLHGAWPGVHLLCTLCPVAGRMAIVDRAACPTAWHALKCFAAAR